MVASPSKLEHKRPGPCCRIFRKNCLEVGLVDLWWTYAWKMLHDRSREVPSKENSTILFLLLGDGDLGGVVAEEHLCRASVPQ